MVNELQMAVASACTLDEIANGLVSFLAQLRASHLQIGFASGIISSDGKEKVFQNLEILRHRAMMLRKHLRFPVLSAACVWNKELYKRVSGLSVSDPEWFAFWRRVLKAGVTDLYLTPRWEASRGSRDEFAAAQELGLRIHVALFHRGTVLVTPYTGTAQMQLAFS